MGKQFVNANLSEIAEGALQERFEHELARVAENIKDPNTDAEKKRKIVMTAIISSDKQREDMVMNFEVKSTLAPRESVGSKVLIDKVGDDIYANELKSGQRGQMFFDPADARLKDDKGTPVEEIEKGIQQETPSDEIIEEQAPMKQTDKIHNFKRKA